MGMTRKDYVAIAEAIRIGTEDMPTLSERRGGNSLSPAESALSIKRSIVEHIADTLASDNPRFERARFMAACGLDPITLQFPNFPPIRGVGPVIISKES